MRWIVLIAYLMGLSIGVHILNLLTIPALVFIYYFRKTQRITFKGIAVSTLISGAILIFINSIIIPHTVYIGAPVRPLLRQLAGAARQFGPRVLRSGPVGSARRRRIFHP